MPRPLRSIESGKHPKRFLVLFGRKGTLRGLLREEGGGADKANEHRGNGETAYHGHQNLLVE
jgi:hypothetical protein